MRPTFPISKRPISIVPEETNIDHFRSQFSCSWERAVSARKTSKKPADVESVHKKPADIDPSSLTVVQIQNDTQFGVLGTN